MEHAAWSKADNGDVGVAIGKFAHRRLQMCLSAEWSTLHAAKRTMGMWVWQSAIWQIADCKCAYQAQIADSSQIEFLLPRKTLSENYRRFGLDKHICDRRFAKSPMARPGTGFGRLEGKRRRAASWGACGQANLEADGARPAPAAVPSRLPRLAPHLQDARTDPTRQLTAQPPDRA